MPPINAGKIIPKNVHDKEKLIAVVISIPTNEKKYTLASSLVPKPEIVIGIKVIIIIIEINRDACKMFIC